MVAPGGGVVERRPVARRQLPVVALREVGSGGYQLFHGGQVTGERRVVQCWFRPRFASLGFQQFRGGFPQIADGVIEWRPSAFVLGVDVQPRLEQFRDQFIHTTRRSGVQQGVAGLGHHVNVGAVVAEKLGGRLELADDRGEQRSPAGVGHRVNDCIPDEQRRHC